MLPRTTDDNLLDNLSYADLFKYSRTCKDAQNTVSSYMRRKHKLETVLGKYFTDAQILYFRHLQATTGMVISGSTALQFFERILYPESDLDLYVEHRYRRPIALWLASIGYRYVAARKTFRSEHHDAGDGVSITATQPTLEEALAVDVPQLTEGPINYGAHRPTIFFYGSGGGYLDATAILNFQKVDEIGQHRKIQIISSPRSPVEMILNFHSTCVMNFITHEKAYSLYPRATFEERRSLICLFSTAARARAWAKYTERGWTMLDGITGDDFHDLDSSLARGRRYVGDSKTWTIPILPKIDTTCPEDLVEMNSWSLHYDQYLKPHLEFSLLISPQLRFCYLVVDEFLREEIWKIRILHKTYCEGDQHYDWFVKPFVTRYLTETIV
ncbi:hypothetical protein M413DRAFT_440763 [Hebeloma cylindrosporum]|uniref:Uncharacterized protein n=1 Tax=Hebeloma cylindrosporum TaxID=76867 RepID=A0A0C2Z272_HEBCY|nr:hypothetical protein M413DRAFT_440763 [Hebeloma cylindrosporum h7]